MIELHPVSRANVSLFKSVRLRALQESPTAFASTYARESQRSDDEWVQRAAEWQAGVKATGFLAVDSGEGCGIAGGYFPDDGGGPFLISMWVAPTHRRTGIGKRLVEAVCDWARSRGANRIVLEVTTTNFPAVRFYERLGFARTGKVSPYPNDPSLQECEMIKSLNRP